MLASISAAMTVVDAMRGRRWSGLASHGPRQHHAMPGQRWRRRRLRPRHHRSLTQSKGGFAACAVRLAAACAMGWAMKLSRREGSASVRRLLPCSAPAIVADPRRARLRLGDQLAEPPLLFRGFCCFERGGDLPRSSSGCRSDPESFRWFHSTQAAFVVEDVPRRLDPVRLRGHPGRPVVGVADRGLLVCSPFARRDRCSVRPAEEVRSHRRIARNCSRAARGKRRCGKRAHGPLADRGVRHHRRTALERR